MKDTWQQLTPNEQRMTVAISILLFIVIALSAWLMLANSVADLHAQVRQRHQLLVFMQQADARLSGHSAKKSSQNSHGDMLALAATLQTDIATMPLAAHLVQLRPTENNTLQLSVKQASFSQLMDFLTQAEEKYGLQVTAANIKHGEQIGIVDATLEMSA